MAGEGAKSGEYLKLAEGEAEEIEEEGNREYLLGELATVPR